MATIVKSEDNNMATVVKSEDNKYFEEFLSKAKDAIKNASESFREQLDKLKKDMEEAAENMKGLSQENQDKFKDGMKVRLFN